MDQITAILKPVKHSTAFGTSALVLGILSCILWLAPYFGLPLGILAVVMSSFQRTRDKRAQEVILGRTTAGTITGIIGIVINTVIGFIGLIMIMVMQPK